MPWQHPKNTRVIGVVRSQNGTEKVIQKVNQTGFMEYQGGNNQLLVVNQQLFNNKKQICYLVLPKN